MKKIFYLAIIAISVFACTQKTVNTTTTTDSHLIGYNYDSTANTEAVKATFASIENYDTVSYASKYADSAKFHDNDKITTLTENVNMQKQFIASGLKVKVKEGYPIWSSHFNFKDGTTGDYVYTYITVTFTKDDKSADVVMFQADRFNKDGKIIEEWLVYDPSNLNSIL